jgi:endonuclease/exonuclease/phosphatase family metal-dependent hydrolase
MKRALVAVAVFGLIGVTQADAGARITVMTRNLYFGADLAPIVASTDPEKLIETATEVLERLAATNFPERAQALAAEIVEKKPHVVGLQEVFDLRLGGEHGLPPFRDYLSDLLGALAAQGADYRAIATVRNLNITVSVPSLGQLRFTDRDVLLARADIAAAPVRLVDAAGSPLCRPSLDGCNYQVFVSVPSPLPGILDDIAIERGFVVVDMLVDGQVFRVANTHLEVRAPDPTNPVSALIQAAQAAELIVILTAAPNVLGAPILVVGDINSSPEDPIVEAGLFTIVPPYTQFVAGGYTDAWTLRPGNPPGFTCCQLGDLSNPESILGERIDVVFSDAVPVRVRANVVGNDESDKTTPSGLWASDHAGVVARLEFAE